MVCCIALAAFSGVAAPVVKVEKAGAEKVTVTIQAGGNAWYIKCLKRNLELSGWFKVGPSGTITVSGTAGGAISATGRGKTITSSESFSGDAGARMAARRFADDMVAAFSDGGKGFAATRLAYVNRKGSDNSELYMCYPDGWDIRQLTSDGRAAVGRLTAATSTTPASSTRSSSSIGSTWKQARASALGSSRTVRQARRCRQMAVLLRSSSPIRATRSCT